MEQLSIFDLPKKEIKATPKKNKNKIAASLENKKILKRYKMHCISKGLTEESLKAIIDNDLSLFIQYIRDTPLNQVDHFLIQDFLLHCQEERKNGDEALSRKFTSLNTFFNTLIKQEVLNIKNPLDKLEKPKVRKKERNFLTYEEYQQILNYLDNCKNINRVRDAALIAFFFSSGCRLAEIHQQNRSNLDFTTRRFKVLGKGAKERICIFSKEAATRIKSYLDTRTDNLEALFVSRQGNRLSRKAIQDTVKTIGKKAGIKKNIHPHIFRHGRAMYLLKNKAPIQTIKKLLGHESIATTEIYAHMDMDSVQDVVAAIDGDI